MSITLTAGQQAAANSVIEFLIDPSQREIVIEGPAGTGKSTLVEHLIQNFDKQQRFINLVLGKSQQSPLEVVVTATTHKAAQVVAELSGQYPRTIHSFLGLKLKNNYRTGATYLEKGKDYKIIKDMIILIDEASFIDRDLLRWIRNTCQNCKIIFIGDPYQLAPVNSGVTPPVFSGEIPALRLTEVRRNTGPIQQLAQGYRDALDTSSFPQLWANNQDILHVDGPTFRSLVNQHFTGDIERDRYKLLAWSNNRVHAYNDYVRELNQLPARYTAGEVVITNKPIMVDGVYWTVDRPVKITSIIGDEVDLGIPGYRVRLENKVGLFIPDNQDQVTALLRQLAQTKSWQTYFYVKENWGDLRPTSACTVHKSQGSTYEKVFIDLSDIGRCAEPTDVARMLYVAISRAKDQVILYGDLPRCYGGKEYAA